MRLVVIEAGRCEVSPDETSAAEPLTQTHDSKDGEPAFLHTWPPSSSSLPLMWDTCPVKSQAENR